MVKGDEASVTYSGDEGATWEVDPVALAETGGFGAEGVRRGQCLSGASGGRDGQLVELPKRRSHLGGSRRIREERGHKRL